MDKPPTTVPHHRYIRYAASLVPRTVFVFLMCVVFPSITSGYEAGLPVTGKAKAAFLQAWGERLRTMHSLHMTFIQEKHLRLLRRPLVTQGELWLKGETLFYVLKNAVGETELKMRLDPQAVKTHYPLLQTLEVIDLHTTQAPPASILFLNRDPTALAKKYEIELFVASGLYTLLLVPRDLRSSVSEIRLTLKDFQPQEFIRIDKNDSRVTMKIAAFTQNPEISEAQLRLHIPAGTKVVYPLVHQHTTRPHQALP